VTILRTGEEHAFVSGALPVLATAYVVGIGNVYGQQT